LASNEDDEDDWENIPWAAGDFLGRSGCMYGAALAAGQHTGRRRSPAQPDGWATDVAAVTRAPWGGSSTCERAVGRRVSSPMTKRYGPPPRPSWTGRGRHSWRLSPPPLLLHTRAKTANTSLAHQRSREPGPGDPTEVRTRRGRCTSKEYIYVDRWPRFSRFSGKYVAFRHHLLRGTKGNEACQHVLDPGRAREGLGLVRAITGKSFGTLRRR
jgi:hypothetical protein